MKHPTRILRTHSKWRTDSNSATTLRAMRQTRVMWLSHGYGYGHDLMYFAPIFRGYARRFPAVQIAMEKDYPVEAYPDLPLWPLLRFWRIKISRNINGVTYDSEIKVPKPSLLYKLARLQFDLVIIIEFTPVALVGFIVARWRGKKVMLLIESDPSLRGSPNSWLIRAIKRFVASRVDVVMTSNELGRAYVTRVLGVARDKLYVAPYLTSDPRVYEQSSPPPTCNRHAVEVRHSDGKLNVLFVNTLSERKGLAELVKAFAQLDLETRCAFVFHIVGDGPLLKPIMREVAAIGAKEYFVFYGHVQYAEIWRFYAIADLFISPTLADYRSLSGFEALNCGKPILISIRDGAAAEVVQEGRNGFVFDPCDPTELARKLAWFNKNRARLPVLAGESRRLSEPYSISNIVQNLIRATTMAIAGDVTSPNVVEHSARVD